MPTGPETLAKPIPALTAEESSRFWSKVAQSDGCWEWIAGLSKGYGTIALRGETFLSHRIAYSLIRGSLSLELTLDHLCRNRRCVNPAHLEEVPLRVNTMRGDGASACNARKVGCGVCGTAYISYPRAIGRRCPSCKKSQDRESQGRRRAAMNAGERAAHNAKQRASYQRHREQRLNDLRHATPERKLLLARRRREANALKKFTGV